jgi:DNA mismatch repair protein MutS2
MNQHSWRVLEVEKILSQIAKQARTKWYAQELTSNIEDQFCSNPEEAMAIMEQARLVARLDENPMFSAPRELEDFSPVLDKLRVQGHGLGPEDLSVLVPAIVEAEMFIPYSNHDLLLDQYSLTISDAKILSQVFQGLEPAKPLLKHLLVYFDQQGGLKEDKIPELVRIKREIQLANQELMSLAKKSLSLSPDMYSSDAPVFRDGRVLLPLKADYKGKIDGVIYGTSDSGQTLYVESRELLVNNNALFQSNAAYIREIHRIFRVVTETLREYIDFLTYLFVFWSYFDKLWVRARWIKDYRAQIPQFTTNIHLPKARHPLLGPRVVPVDITYQEPVKLLVLTGPNTGGKTVALKTLGIFGVLSQLGIPLLTGENPEIPWFSGVFADIGDEQSIEHQLSTFSAHITNTAQVLQGLDQGSLVLLDELGTGTDPLEGGALAVAVLEELATKSCYGLVTSHHGSVKAYAFGHPTMDNAAMEFNVQSKAPSYRILYGVPGESRALDIAQRVGFPARVLDRARELVGDQASSVDSLLSGILEKDQQLSQLLAQVKKEHKELEIAQAQVESDQVSLENKKTQILDQALAEAEELLAQTRKRIESAIQEFYSDVAGLKDQFNHEILVNQSSFTQSGSNQKLLQQKAKEISNTLRFVTKQESEAIQTLKNQRNPKQATSRTELVPGVQVRIQGSAQRGTLIQKQRTGKWLVQAGMIKMTIQEDYLEPIVSQNLSHQGSQSFGTDQTTKVIIEYAESGSTQNSEGTTSKLVNEPSGAPLFTLDVRGMRLEPALKLVEEQIDKALVHGLMFFSIIHGKGTGVLQQGIHDLLKSHTQVSSFSFARPEDGGFGKTLVNLSS